jgi:hypothetical protein
MSGTDPNAPVLDRAALKHGVRLQLCVAGLFACNAARPSWLSWHGWLGTAWVLVLAFWWAERRAFGHDKTLRRTRIKAFRSLGSDMAIVLLVTVALVVPALWVVAQAFGVGTGGLHPSRIFGMLPACVFLLRAIAGARKITGTAEKIYPAKTK